MQIKDTSFENESDELNIVNQPKVMILEAQLTKNTKKEKDTSRGQENYSLSRDSSDHFGSGIVSSASALDKNQNK